MEAERDEQLICRLQEGDERALETLMERYWRRVERLVVQVIGDPAAAEEVVQEVFLSVYQKVNQFEGKAAFSTWLYRIAVNAALMRLRREGRREFVSLAELEEERAGEEGEPEPSLEGQILQEESLLQIEKAMERMPVELKTVFILRDIEGFSSEETSEILGLTIAAVKSRLHRGRRFLRLRLSRLYPENWQE